ncbi:hypothetical protein GCM10027521_33910 [Amycolatopsis cihanbeyliensis]
MGWGVSFRGVLALVNRSARGDAGCASASRGAEGVPETQPRAAPSPASTHLFPANGKLANANGKLGYMNGQHGYVSSKLVRGNGKRGRGRQTRWALAWRRG